MKVTRRNAEYIRFNSMAYGVSGFIQSIADQHASADAARTVRLVASIAAFLACVLWSLRPANEQPSELMTPDGGFDWSSFCVFVGSLILESLTRLLLQFAHIPEIPTRIIAVATVVIVSYAVEDDGRPKPPKKRTQWSLQPAWSKS